MGRFTGGWVKINRSLCDGTYDATDIGILFWLICNANYTDGKALVRSGHKRVNVKRGSLVTSVKEMELALGCARGLIRKRLKNFEIEEIITIETTNTGSIITICNYDKYQSMEGMEEPAVEPSENHRRTIGEPSESHIIKNIRNKENKNETKEGVNNQEMATAIVSLWNTALTSVLPQVSRVTSKRLRLLSAQVKKYPDLQHWQDAFSKLKASDFLSGRSGKWKASFDWMLNENNRIKVIEGNYDNDNQSKNKQSWEEKVRWL